MTDARDDDPELWEIPEWIRSDSGALPPIRSHDDVGAGTRAHRLGQLARDVTGALPLTRRDSFERTRTHHVVTPRPAAGRDRDPADDWAPVEHWLEPEANQRGVGRVDPTLLRIGAVALVGVLMVPIALALRSHDDGELRADAVTTATTDVPAPSTTVVTIPATVAPTPGAAGPAIAVAGSASAEHGGASQNVTAAAVRPEAPACAGTYVVIANDFWNRFPKTSGASVDAWLAANDATTDTPLYVGDELCIPPGAKAPAPPPATTTPAPSPTVTSPPAPEPTAATTPTSAAAVAVATQPPAPAPVVTQPPAPAPVVTVPPAPPPLPVAIQPPAPVATGAPSTQALCGAMPTSNGNPAGTPGPAAVEAMIREIWPDDIEVRALCIAKHEARLRADLNNYCCYGVFALYFDYISPDLRRAYGVDEASDLYDARTNIAIAYQVYLRGGWKPWSQTDPGPG